ncbi:MAG: type III polyketide synthase [Planctomycetota bacterium]|nr:type III polyketide synthase [Planctomycetota bacterium]
MALQIHGMGAVVPNGRLSQEQAAQMGCLIGSTTTANAKTITALYRRSGVKQRHSVALEPADPAESYVDIQQPSCIQDFCSDSSFYSPARSAQDRGPTTAERMAMFERRAGRLAIAASEKALEDAHVEGHEISHLITITCTGFFNPGVDFQIIEACHLPPSCSRTQIGFMGCHGAVNGLRVAKSMAEADPRAKILMCAFELCTLHQQYGTDPQHRVSNSLFSDGAAALVVSGSDSENLQDPSVVSVNSTILPSTSDKMSWKIRDHGFEMTLSPEVPTIIENHLRPWMDSWLSKHDLRIPDIKAWGIHPGGPKILGACETSLALPPEQLEISRRTLAEFGNMSSPTVLFILDQFRKRQFPFPWALLAFGPGLSIEAALIA